MEKKFYKTADSILKEKWWQGLLIGICLTAFGIVLLAWPGITSAVIVKMIGILAAVIGVYRLIQVLRFNVDSKNTQPKSMLIAETVAGIVIGLMAFLFPGVIEVAAIIIMGIGMIYYGIFDFWAGFSLNANRVKTMFKWLLVLDGLLSVLVGIFLLSNPVAGLLSVLWIIATYLVVFGGMNIILSFFHPNRK